MLFISDLHLDETRPQIVDLFVRGVGSATANLHGKRSGI